MRLKTQDLWVERLSPIMTDESKSAKEVAVALDTSVYYATRLLGVLHRHQRIHIAEWRRSGMQKERAFKIGKKADAPFEKKSRAVKQGGIKTKDGGVL